MIRHSRRLGIGAVIMLGTVLLQVGATMAGDTYWQHDPATQGDWFGTFNWTAGVPRSSSDFAYVQNGGTVSVSGGSGMCGGLYVGGTDPCTMLHSAGYMRVIDLKIGWFGTGTYWLGAGGTLSASVESIGSHTDTSQVGSFIQDGGVHELDHSIKMGRFGTGTYEMNDGILRTGRLHVGDADVGYPCLFRQNGGSCQVWDGLSVGRGTYELHGGDLLSANFSAAALDIRGGQSFLQTGGDHTVADTAYVRGCYEQTGGVLVAEGRFFVLGQNASYVISGGTASFSELIAGPTFGGLEPGEIRIANASASLSVATRLCLGPKGTLAAVPGATVCVGDASVENQSTDESALAGLSNLGLVFQGAGGGTATLEVGGMDLGAELEGFRENFALASISLGGEAYPSVRLVDAYDNGNRGGPAGVAEALYLHNLTLGPGSTLDMNTLHIYYDGVFLSQGAILNGQPVFVPEPGTLALLAVGGLLAMRRRMG